MTSQKHDSQRVGILGAGPFGVALGCMLAKSGRPVTIWSTTSSVVDSINRDHRCDRLPGLQLPEGLVAVDDLQVLVNAARFLVLAVSSESAYDRLRTLGKYATSSHIAVHAIGALAPEGDRRITEIMGEETPILRCGVIAGPSMAADIAAGRATSLVCASEFDEVTSESMRLLSVPATMRLYRSRDVVGAELASALSGAYTIAVGLADGLEVGIGTRAVLITRAISEMTRLGTALGGDPKTFAGLAGLANLLVRSAVEDGRIYPSYRYGLDLVKGENNFSGEGKRAAIAGLRVARARGLSVPILETVGHVIAGTVSPAEVAGQIFETVSEEE